jgi:hypothetical protein
MMWDKALEQAHERSLARGERQRHAGDVNGSHDYVVLADGSIFAVQRNNLAAAKELLAAQKAALRRVIE